MPYKSDAQRRFFHAAEARGDIGPATVKEFDEASKGKRLPEHVKKMSDGGYACMYCGGCVDMPAGHMEPDADDNDDITGRFAEAIKNR